VSAAKLALAALLLLWLARSGRLDFKVFAALDGRALRWLGLATLLQALMIVAMAARWRCWLHALAPAEGAAARLSWSQALLVTARGTCVGAWTPAGLGLDGIRAAHALRLFRTASPQATPLQEAPQEAPQLKRGHGAGLLPLLRGEGGGIAGGEGAGSGIAGGGVAGGGIAGGGIAGSGVAGSGVGRLVGLASLLDRLVALAILVALALPFLLSRLVASPGQPKVALALALSLALSLAVLVLAAVAARRRAGAGPGGLARPGVPWSEALAASWWALGTHLFNILALGAILKALAPQLEAGRALSLAFEVGPVIILSGALPLTPLGLGVADATGEALLAQHGLDCGGEAVMMARATWLGVCLLAGLAFWLPDNSRRQN